MVMATDTDVRGLDYYARKPWTLFASDVLNAGLDPQQEDILLSFQYNSRTTVRSGHARGKDYVAAVCALCFLILRAPCKVILTAPTQRQVDAIMMSECKRLARNSHVQYGGDWGACKWSIAGAPEWFLLGFKAGDNKHEAWTGFHSENLAVIITEASGVTDDTFNAVEGLLTGNSRLLLAFNPNRCSGEAYRSFTSPLYQGKFTLSCLDAPNVVAGKTLIPGQVDKQWITNLLSKPGWVDTIDERDATEDGDFQLDGVWYRARDLFRVKVLGLWPKESEHTLIPLSWIEAANERWIEQRCNLFKAREHQVPIIGADIAGMGNDLTVFCPRYDNVVTEFITRAKSNHMETVGELITLLHSKGGAVCVDTIGEGAGVFSRLAELNANAYSVKFSHAGGDLADMTGERRFKNLRAYCYWALRDALDPTFGYSLALPPCDELSQDLTSIEWMTDSQGRIYLEPKDDIKKRLGRSPDYGDSLALTFAPMNVCFDRIVTPTEASMEVLAWA